MSERKPASGFWITVALVAVLVLYPLSFGPACWIVSRTNAGADWLPFCYRPIITGLSIDRTSLSAVIQWYSRLGATQGWVWVPDGIPLSDAEWIAVEWVWMPYPGELSP
jgi:hypothetical protein